MIKEKAYFLRIAGKINCYHFNVIFFLSFSCVLMVRFQSIVQAGSELLGSDDLSVSGSQVDRVSDSSFLSCLAEPSSPTPGLEI